MDISIFGPYLLDEYNNQTDQSRNSHKAKQIERYVFSSLFPYDKIIAYRILSEPQNDEAAINKILEDLLKSDSN